MVSIVSRKYSEALYLVGIEKDKLQEFEKEISELREVIKMNREIMTSLCHPELPLNNKIQIIDALFVGKISKEIVALLNIILKKSRQEFIPEILDAFIEKCKEHDNISTAVIMSAEKLSDEHMNEIIKKLENKISKKIEVLERIDENLIGGVKIIVDNLLYDSTIDGKIKNIYKAIS